MNICFNENPEQTKHFLAMPRAISYAACFFIIPASNWPQFALNYDLVFSLLKLFNMTVIFDIQNLLYSNKKSHKNHMQFFMGRHHSSFLYKDIEIQRGIKMLFY